ncbi:MAG: antitoxin [Eubacterium sp.]|nr:antitoxin [Eubacterium sp.]
MKSMDRDGLFLCDLQAKTFEESIDVVPVSSEIFIRRFMNSEAARSLDSGYALQVITQPEDIFIQIEEQYGPSNYGSVKYSHNEMAWIGYLYRYFAYTYELSTLQVYKIVKPKELRDLFLPYHTLDTSQAIERILEAKGMLLTQEEELKRQYEIFRRIRKGGA